MGVIFKLIFLVDDVTIVILIMLIYDNFINDTDPMMIQVL